jgi:GH24 family phage-related lysozyme (muramidase)
MSWFLDGRDGLSQVSSDGFEEEFWPTGSRLDIAAMKAAAGSLVIDRTKGRPMKRAEPTTITKRSPAADALAKRWEGYHKALPDGRCTAYPDVLNTKPPRTRTGWGKPWTIGFGTIEYRKFGEQFGRTQVREGDVITREQAEIEMDAELDWCEAALAERLGDTPMTQPMFDAMVSFVYNLGIGFIDEDGEPKGAYLQIERLRAREYEDCATMFDAYVNGGVQGLINRRNEEEALFRSQPFPSSPEKPETSIAALRPISGVMHSGAWAGLRALSLLIGDQEFSVASGARGAQNFRRPQDPRSVPGNLEPLPQGRYSIGDIQWASGKDSYEGTHGAGLGPVWIPLSAEFSDDRGSFGIHLDQNIGTSPGSAGCVVCRDLSDLKRLVAALRKHDPSTLSVEWGL